MFLLGAVLFALVAICVSCFYLWYCGYSMRATCILLCGVGVVLCRCGKYDIRGGLAGRGLHGHNDAAGHFAG